MRLHKTILLFALLGIVSSASAQDVSVNVNTCFVDRVTGRFDSFKWKWAGYNTQSNTLYLFSGSTSTPYVVTGKNIGFRMSTETDAGQTDYINTTNVTIVASNQINWVVANTNIAPSGTYDAEIMVWDGAATNNSRSVAQGTITTFKSLYDDTSTTFPFPSQPSTVSRIIAGTDIGVSPAGGIGDVTVSYTGSSGGGDNNMATKTNWAGSVVSPTRPRRSTPTGAWC